MNRKLGVSAKCLAGIAPIDALPYIKEAGFECFFIDQRSLEDTRALKEAGDKLGLDFEFIHATWRYKDAMGGHFFMNEFFQPGLSYLPLFDATIEALDIAAECGIPCICQHITSGWVAPPATDIGFERFDRLVEHAIKRGVKLSLENLRNYGLLAALLERYERVPEVGFCYDNGHEHCYTETVPFLDLWGKRTFCTHLHDNFGRDKEDPMKDADYHLLPYDGNFDYAEMIRKMDRHGYSGSLTLEVSQYGKYKEMSPKDFLAMLYERTVRLSKGEK